MNKWTHTEVVDITMTEEAKVGQQEENLKASNNTNKRVAKTEVEIETEDQAIKP